MWTLHKIPKIAHFYWHGGFLSWLRYLTLKTFQIQNPDWELRFYFPKREHTGEADWEAHSKERTGVTGRNYLQEIKNIPNTKCIEFDFNDDTPDVFRSDLLRLKLLGEDGGLWLDMDVISFRPMSDGVFNTDSNIDTIISYTLERYHYSIGFMLGSTNNSFYKFLYEKGMSKQEPKNFLFDKYGDRQKYGVILWDSYFKNPEAISKRFTQLNVYNIDFFTCYPYIYNNLDKVFKEVAPLEKSVIALHWYAGHPDTRKWENLLTPENYQDYNSTLCRCIKAGLNEN